MRRILKGSLLAFVLLLGIGVLVPQPAEARARHSMSFSLGDRSRPQTARVSRHRRAGHGHARSGRSVSRRSHGVRPRAQRVTGEDEGSAAKAVPGKGFTLENGVLTYPAPARFQPRNLKRR